MPRLPDNFEQMCNDHIQMDKKLDELRQSLNRIGYPQHGTRMDVAAYNIWYDAYTESESRRKVIRDEMSKVEKEMSLNRNAIKSWINDGVAVVVSGYEFRRIGYDNLTVERL